MKNKFNFDWVLILILPVIFSCNIFKHQPPTLKPPIPPNETYLIPESKPILANTQTENAISSIDSNTVNILEDIFATGRNSESYIIGLEGNTFPIHLNNTIVYTVVSYKDNLRILKSGQMDSLTNTIIYDSFSIWEESTDENRTKMDWGGSAVIKIATINQGGARVGFFLFPSETEWEIDETIEGEFDMEKLQNFLIQITKLKN